MKMKRMVLMFCMVVMIWLLCLNRSDASGDELLLGAIPKDYINIAMNTSEERFSEPELPVVAMGGEDDGLVWDMSGLMNGISVRLDRIYELDANGNRVKGVAQAMASADGIEVPTELAKNKTYEVTMELYNDSELDACRVVEVRMPADSGDDGWFLMTASIAQDVSFWGNAPSEERVLSNDVFWLTVAPGIKITPATTFWLVQKDLEVEHCWGEYTQQYMNNQLGGYVLRTQVYLGETSRQMISFVFVVE